MRHNPSLTLLLLLVVYISSYCLSFRYGVVPRLISSSNLMLGLPCQSSLQAAVSPTSNNLLLRPDESNSRDASKHSQISKTHRNSKDDVVLEATQLIGLLTSTESSHVEFVDRLFRLGKMKAPQALTRLLLADDSEAMSALVKRFQMSLDHLSAGQFSKAMYACYLLRWSFQRFEELSLRDAVLRVFREKLLFMTSRNTANVLYVMAKSGLKWDRLSLQDKVVVEFAIVKNVHAPDVLQAMQALDAMNCPWDDLAPNTKDTIGERVYAFVRHYTASSKVASTGGQSYAWNHDYNSSVALSSFIYVLPRLGLQYSSLPSPIKASLQLAILGLDTWSKSVAGMNPTNRPIVNLNQLGEMLFSAFAKENAIEAHGSTSSVPSDEVNPNFTQRRIEMMSNLNVKKLQQQILQKTQTKLNFNFIDDEDNEESEKDSKEFEAILRKELRSNSNSKKPQIETLQSPLVLKSDEVELMPRDGSALDKQRLLVEEYCRSWTNVLHAVVRMQVNGLQALHPTVQDAIMRNTLKAMDLVSIRVFADIVYSLSQLEASAWPKSLSRKVLDHFMEFLNNFPPSESASDYMQSVSNILQSINNMKMFIPYAEKNLLEEKLLGFALLAADDLERCGNWKDWKFFLHSYTNLFSKYSSSDGINSLRINLGKKVLWQLLVAVYSHQEGRDAAIMKYALEFPLDENDFSLLLQDIAKLRISVMGLKRLPAPPPRILINVVATMLPKMDCQGMSGALFAIARLGIELDKCTPVLMKAISSFVQMQEEQFDPTSLSLLIRSLGELKFRWNLLPEELYSLVRASPFMSNDAKVIKKKVVSLLHLHLNSCPKNSFINILRGCAVLGLTWREFLKFGLLNEMIRMMHNKLSEDQFYRNPSEVITVLSALVRLQNNSMRYKSQYGNNAPSELGELRSFLASLRKGIAAFEQEGKWGDRERSTVASLWKELDLL